ncbi:MAG TPA: hydantoinase/oxoprolinase family protein [Acidimicrobiales bacterium]|jgi:N-methylhydantoinase A/oxoprolinase/acetone carboxylase beta subunit|nr:hydantoinase/oxoprolinase family protein [Acidimicrobiales bacterium]
MRFGVDTGGTFTDAVGADGAACKVPSTPREPAASVRLALDELGGCDTLAHGTTVATNALLERRLATVALVTNEGFADVIEIARQVRPSLYDPFADRPDPPVPRRLRVEVAGRLAADGTTLRPVDLASLPPLPTEVDAVAVCLLHSDLDPGHEREVGDHLRARGLDVTCSCDVSPEFREYERMLTTVVDAGLRPVCRAYLEQVGSLAPRVFVMTSSGGLVPAGVGAEHPALLTLSGPAGGVRAAAAIAAANGWPDAVSLDMGGTSTDVCLIQGAVPDPAPGREVGGWPLRLPAIDVHTIGAGGGSIARIDPGGALVVGPESAGADPGPACYGRGGRHPTVTDADLVLGRVPDAQGLGGLGKLDRAAALAAIEGAGVTAEGICRVVDVGMEGALRVVSVARGVDPRGLALVAFGGAGPLHAVALAEALDMACVIVPPRAGVLSAVGLLGAPERREVVRSWPHGVSTEGLAAHGERLAAEAVALVGGDPETTSAEVVFDARYVGQGHELIVADVARFHDEHLRRNGFARPDAPIEVVALRARAWRDAPIDVLDLPVPDRPAGLGPCVLAEPDCTIWVPDGWEAVPGEAGALILQRRARPASTVGRGR